MGEQFQSAYKKAHSTETALMKVKDDVMASLTQHQGIFLVLSDLSRLEKDLGIQGNVLLWFRSYLSDRTSRVCIDGQLSKPEQMEFGLPQGSIVGPLGFSLYVVPVGHIIKSFGLQYHMYVDDVQLSCTHPLIQMIMFL